MYQPVIKLTGEPVAIVNSTANKAATIMRTWAPVAAAPVVYAVGDLLGISDFIESILTKYTGVDPNEATKLSMILGVIGYIGAFFAFWKGGVISRVIAFFAIGMGASLFFSLKEVVA